MKKLFLFSLAATLISSFSFATIRRVGYFGPAVSGIDYATFQLAHDASTSGDTLMMHPGSKFGTATMTKKLVVIGPGYFLSQNIGLQANPLGMDSTSAEAISIQTNASNSIFMGCTFYYNGILFTQSASNVSFIRCRFNGIGNGNQSVFCVQFKANVNNILFSQCMFNGDVVCENGPGVVATNISFINSLFTFASGFSTHYGIYFNSNQPNSGIFQNCVFTKPVNQSFPFYLRGTWQMNNCISNSSDFQSAAGVTYQNCIGTATQFPAGNGNLQNQTWANIFTLTGSADAQYTLKAGSPAIGAGIGGTNCGIFGGTTPYKLSGIPSVPTIYAISSPQGNTPTVNTVQINLSTRSNN